MSKANQSFKQNEEAVSPVIGVILMVAITVVLAAVVFVLVSNLGKGSSTTPTFVLNRDDTSDRLSVTSADSDADWNRLALKTTAADVCVSANQAATLVAGCDDTDAFDTGDSVLLLATNTELTANPHLMQAGDYIEFCTNDVAAATSVSIVIVDTSANSVVGTFNFNDISICA